MQVKSIAESAILFTCIKQPPVFKTFVLSIFERPFKTGFAIDENAEDTVMNCGERVEPFTCKFVGSL